VFVPDPAVFIPAELFAVIAIDGFGDQVADGLAAEEIDMLAVVAIGDGIAESVVEV
jgi:hypothetical protein